MQNRAKFSVLPVAEIYARKTLELNWPAGQISLRDQHSQLVSPLLTKADAIKLQDELRTRSPANSSAIRCATSRLRNNSEQIRFRVVINLDQLTCTQDEFNVFKQSLSEREQIDLLAAYLNYVHAPFGEKYWNAGIQNGQLHLCYLAPSRSYNLIKMRDIQGNLVFDEEHNGWEYENALKYNYINLARINGFTADMQKAFRENIKIRDAFRVTFYYFNPDFIPHLLNMLNDTLSGPTLVKDRSELSSSDSSSEGVTTFVQIPAAMKPLPTTEPPTNIPEPARFFHTPPEYKRRHPARLDSDFDDSNSDEKYKLNSSACSLM